jgi:PAS domain-containing protein
MARVDIGAIGDQIARFTDEMRTIIERYGVVEGGIATLGTQILAGVVAAALLAMLWRRRDEPTARPLLFVAIALFVFVAGNVLTTIEGLPFYRDLGFFRSSIVGSCWLVFALQYTGRSERLERWCKRVLVVLIPVSIVLLTARGILLTSYDYQSPYLDLTALFVQLPLSATLFVSTLVLGTATLRQKALPMGQGALLSASPVVLMLTRVLTAPGRIGSPLAVPIGITLSTLCLVVALRRYRVFETLPVATSASREQVVESTGEGIMLVDREDRLRDYNERAAAILDIGPAALEQPLSSVQSALPEPRRLATLDRRVRVQIPDGPLLSVQATAVSNERGHRFGYTLVVRDITQRHTREQRLTVLNQLLVDIAHDRMAAVASDASALAETTPEEGPDAIGTQIWDATTDLTALVGRTREIEQALAETAEGAAVNTTEVTTTVQAVIDEVSDGECESFLFASGDEQFVVPVNETLVEIAVRTLLECATGDPTDAVAVDVSRLDQTSVELRLDVRTTSTADPSNVIDELSLQVMRLAINCVGGAVIASETSRTATVRMQLPTETGQTGLIDGEARHAGGVQS